MGKAVVDLLVRDGARCPGVRQCRQRLNVTKIIK